MQIQPGRVIEPFEVVELLGQGAMASVYLVRHVHLDAPYALKVLHVHEPLVAERLLNEGRVQAALRHPNVVGVSDVIRVQGRPGLVLEFVDGPSLESFIQDYGPLAIDDIRRIGLGMMKGLRAAHRAGHLHRDLKPANVLMDWLDDEWVPKITDFGLAKYLFAGADGETSVTRTGQIMGSPTFMSPEQCRDAKAVDERADVFALGAVLYELATQRRAFDAPDVVSVFARIVSGAFVPVHELRPDLPDAMMLAIHGALVVDPARRIPDCDTLMAVWRGERTFSLPDHDMTGSVVALLGDAAALAPSASHPTIDSPRRTRRPPSAGRVVGSVALLGAVGGLLVGATALGFLVFYVAVTWLVPAPSSQPAVGASSPPVVAARAPAPVAPALDVGAEVEAAQAAHEPVAQPRAPQPTPATARPLPAPVSPRPAQVAGSAPKARPGGTADPPAAPEPLGFAEIASRIAAHPAPPTCFEAWREGGLEPPARVTVGFRLTGEGAVADVRVREPRDLRGTALERCLGAAMQGISFPATGLPDQSLTYPFQP